MSMRRFTRLTNASARSLKTCGRRLPCILRITIWSGCTRPCVTPTMAANVTDRVWSLEQLVDQTSDNSVQASEGNNG
jgi:hypothetical protein